MVVFVFFNKSSDMSVSCWFWRSLLIKSGMSSAASCCRDLKVLARVFVCVPGDTDCI